MDKIRTKPPSLRFLFAHPAHLIALGSGSGLSPVAPGTAGTLFAWAIFLPLRAMMDDVTLLAFLAVCLLGGVFAVHKTGADLGVVDHGSIVWDEFVGMWITLMALPTLDWQWVAAGFVIFRIFDMWKPWPIRWFDRNIHGGMGIMVDDIVAGVISAGVLYVIGHHWPIGLL